MRQAVLRQQAADGRWWDMEDASRQARLLVAAQRGDRHAILMLAMDISRSGVHGLRVAGV